ncbi:MULTISPECIES: glycerophosphodiester phosphodiesterase [Actinomadura]|uniref:Glycerophosphodiester phosphodiesterase n=1 Tax=Actinomadura yumaensis TaxID=111807 RepID=A0ABW2CGE5_9ACTN|nr:glycerophosphodiester phosphodiesterase family protein [Actinomadura sp. J1-007]MWK35694.1 hydrolase [Actinomadura sp. J1-007]
MRKVALRAALVSLIGLAPAFGPDVSANAAPARADVIAHRGSSGVAPENTAAAIRTAIRQKADFVEIDVQRTKDGRLVNFHDCTMERTTDVEERFPGRPSYRVSDFTWNQLRTLDAGSWFNKRYAGERIASVREVIQQVRGKIGLLAEISPCDHYDGLPEDINRELRAVPGYLHRALARGELGVQSFVVEDAERFHELLPQVPIGVLDAERPSDAELVALSKWADDVNPQFTVTDKALVDRVHALGMGINVWTVDEPGSIRTMLGLGVNGIITDYPQSITQR